MAETSENARTLSRLRARAKRKAVTIVRVGSDEGSPTFQVYDNRTGDLVSDNITGLLMLEDAISGIDTPAETQED